MDAKPSDIVTLDLGYGQVLRLSPSIYYPPERRPGESQESYPGVAININLESQEVNLNLEQFTNFMETLAKFDFNQMGLLLLQNYLLLRWTTNSKTGCKRSIKPRIAAICTAGTGGICGSKTIHQSTANP